MITPMQNAFITAIDWGTRFPVTIYNSYGRFYNMGNPSSVYNESKVFFDSKYTACLNLLRSLSGLKRHDSKKSRRKIYSKWESRIKHIRDTIPEKKYNWFLIRYHILSNMVIDMIPPFSILAIEDQPIFYADSYNSIIPIDDSWLSIMRIDILFAFILAKAENKGIDVIRIPPTYTSTTCPMCGGRNSDNRDKRVHRYICDTCGTVLNDDSIAALNIHNEAYRQRFGRFVGMDPALYGDTKKIVMLKQQQDCIEIPHDHILEQETYVNMDYSSMLMAIHYELGKA